MIKRVDFYLINNRVQDAKFKLASRLCNKLQRVGTSILVVTENEDELQKLDDLLWHFNDVSFVAHDRAIEGANPSLIHIGVNLTINSEVLDRNYDVLISLCRDAPLFKNYFNRIAEIVEDEETEKANGRSRYKSYKNEGFELNTHQIEL